MEMKEQELKFEGLFERRQAPVSTTFSLERESEGWVREQQVPREGTTGGEQGLWRGF